MDKYPGYAAWMAQIAERDGVFLMLVIVSAIILLWMLYTRTIFKKFAHISRAVTVIFTYASIIGLQLVLGSAVR